VTDQAIHLTLADWGLAGDSSKGRLSRLLHEAPLTQVRIELADLEKVTGGRLSPPLINDTYRVPIAGTKNPWTDAGWPPVKVLEAILSDLIELRKPLSDREAKTEVWIAGTLGAILQPRFPPQCVVCLEPAVDVVPMRVKSQQVRMPNEPFDAMTKRFEWTSVLFEPGVAYCKKHRGFQKEFHASISQTPSAPGVKLAYCIADVPWQLGGPVFGSTPDLTVTAICLKFKNLEYQSLFCRANDLAPG
jgi:hypothetical protein